jgi:hypothetical protein
MTSETNAPFVILPFTTPDSEASLLGVVVRLHSPGGVSRSRSLLSFHDDGRWDPSPSVRCCSCRRSHLTHSNAYRCVEFQVNAQNQVGIETHSYRFPRQWTYKVNHFNYEHLCRRCFRQFLDAIVATPPFTLHPSTETKFDLPTAAAATPPLDRRSPPHPPPSHRCESSSLVKVS